MKKVFFLALICLWSCSKDNEDGHTQEPPAFLGELDWVKNFGGSGDETAHAIIPTTDGGFAVFGFTNSINGDITDKTLAVNDYWLVKLDAEGNLQWNKTYGGSKDDRGQSIAQTLDGGYVIVGYAMSDDGDGSNNEGFHDNWILKLDAAGEMEWEQSFGFSGHDHSYDVIQTIDGGFFFAGFLDVTQSGGEGNFGKGNYWTRHGVGEFWGTKLDAQGNLVWRRYFGGTNNDRAHSVVQANDGGFVLSGFSESDDFDISNSKGSYDFWVVKINEVGDLIWENSFGGTGIEISYGMTKTKDNGYVIVGNTFSNDTDVSKNNGESDVWLIKIDDTGNLSWERNFGGTQFDAAESVSLAADGGFIVTGNSKSSDIDLAENVGENDIWVLKTNSEGALIWQKSFGGTNLDYGFDALETGDGNIMVVGESHSLDFNESQRKGLSDMVVIKIK
ncbi:hypothetical protein GGR42_002055 [Saonia flava]|uniref:Bulb-type lectin domain-containing protein n=1 Tax=Saonia flava TaxID=523696 RepID=A0A846QZH2_9FLAO|nr:hypothetical protein [Saonia flava]NJB71593.1 hypothetical protein [Saonia flava]